MSEVKNVRNLEDLLLPSLKQNETIESSEISILTAPGENYGSIVLRIVIKVKNAISGKCKTIDAVGKIIPDSKRVQELFNTQVTFRNEFKFYSSIVPLLNTFVNEKGITTEVDFTAPFLGGRINLNNNEEVDTDAIILMQNLKSIGYTTGKKTEGLDLQASKIVINSLAKFHAVGLALKILEPKKFKNELSPHFSDYVPEKEFLQKVKESLYHTLRNNDVQEEEIKRISLAMNRDCRKKNISEIWGTMIHYDTWTNNLLIRYKENMPVHSIIVDFQDFGYGTPLNDLMFFLFTSVETLVLEKSLDDLLQYYYKTFITNMKNLSVETANYTWDSYENEIKVAVKYYEYCHCMWMLPPIMNKDLKSLDDMDQEGVGSWDNNHVQKVMQITRLSLLREWL